MAWNNYNNEDVKSKFNAGLLGTNRINETLKLINFCKTTPLMKNLEYGGEWNFKLWFSGIDVIYEETDPYMNPKERKDCQRLKKAIEKFMDDYPVVEYKKCDNPNRKKETINDIHWRALKKFIEKYGRKVRRFGVKYEIIGAIAEEDLKGL